VYRSSYEVSVTVVQFQPKLKCLDNFRKWLISEFMNSHSVVRELFHICGWTDAHDNFNMYGAWVVNVPKRRV
jgi:hypothetical protein